MANPDKYESVDMRLNKIEEKTRQFRRKFKEVMGLPPKLYMRILRIERVMAEMYNNPDIDYLSKLHGFYDQPHFIRECKKFTGRTPKQIIATFQNPQARKVHNNLKLHLN